MSRRTCLGIRNRPDVGNLADDRRRCQICTNLTEHGYNPSTYLDDRTLNRSCGLDDECHCTSNLHTTV